MRKICLDPGHGGHDSGANFEGLNEKDVVLSVCKFAGQAMRDYGYDVQITREIDVFIPLSERCAIANSSGSDCFVSVHCNADPDEDLPGDPEAKGEEIWYFEGSAKGKKLAEIMAEQIDKLMDDEPFRGIKPTTRLYVLKHTNMPAILIELGFIDNSQTSRKFADIAVHQEAAELIMKGVMNYYEAVG